MLWNPKPLIFADNLKFVIVKKNMSQKNNLSAFAIFIAFIFIFSCQLLIGQKWNNLCLLTWDIFGYYTYLPALFYGNLGKLSNIPAIIASYNIGAGMNNFHLLENGNYIIKYTSGMAILYSPFFFIAHIWAKLCGYLVDGFSYPYQFCIAWGCSLYACIGLGLIRKLLLRYFLDKYVAISIICLSIGTHFLNYATFDSPMAHAPLFTVFALILLKIDDWYYQATPFNTLILGLLCGFAAMTRPTEILVLIVFFFWKMEHFNFQTITNRLLFFLQENKKLLLLFSIAFLIGLLPQLLYWQIYSGSPIFYSYGDEGFDFSGKYLFRCFFSYKKGWLIYTPMMVFAILGLFSLVKKYSQIGLAVMLFFLINTYVLFSWHDWGYGGGFGQRAMIDSYPLLLFPMTAFWESVLSNWKRWLVFPSVAFCIWLNLFQIGQAQRGQFETEEMTKAYYWRIFGKTKMNDKIDRKLLDTPEEMPENLVSHSQLIYKNDFEAEIDTIPKPLTSGKHSIEITKGKSKWVSVNFDKYSKRGWLRAEVKWLSLSREPYLSWSPVMSIMLKNGEKVVKQNNIRVHRYPVTKCNGDWEDVWIDMEIPESTPFNDIVVSIYTDSGTITYIDDLQLKWCN